MKYLRKYNAHSDYIKPISLKAIVSYCKKEVEVHFKKREHDYSKDYLTFESLDSNNSFFFIGSDSNYLQTIQISLDNGETWIEKSSSLEKTIIFTLNKGEKVLIKSNSWHQNSKDNFNQNRFDSYKKYKIYGNIASLLYGDNFQEQTTTNIARAFQGLFNVSERLIDASNLIIPICTEYTCYYMFMNCNSLKYPPKITATTTGANCYMRMFQECPKLEYCPELPAMQLTIGCYYAMFKGCTSLVKVQDILPATSLPASCYQYMFEGCTSLIQAPELPAISLGGSCYYGMFSECTSLVTPPSILGTIHGNDCCSFMFSGCTSLTTAPKLPAVNLATRSYRGMFKGCTSLIQAPELPAQTLVFNCYYEMFQNCTSLNYVKASFITDPGTNLTNWLDNVSPTGIFIKNPEAEWDVVGASGIPEGWIICNKSGGYLESTGTQYINTGIVPNSNTRLVIDMSITNNADVNNGLIQSGKRFHIGKYSSKFHFGIAGSHTFGEVHDNDRHILELNGNGIAKWDDLSYTVSTTPLSGVTIPISLFGRNTNGTTNNFIVGKMWSCKIYDGDTLIMDLIPVEKDDTGYMYDQITYQLFENVGTGNFIYGEDI